MGRMLTFLADPVKMTSEGGWRNLSRGVRFTRFEYMSYQQWCVMHEGFRFRDVTNVSGEAKWGSYLEDPLPGARVSELEPLWISAEALSKAERGEIPTMRKTAPPLMIFHADHEALRFFRGGDEEKILWEKLMLDLLKRHGRTDFDKDSIKL